jgi:hypothetical protein
MNRTTALDVEIPAALADAADLATFVDRAWDLHADRSGAVAAALRTRADLLSGDDAGAGAIGLAEHVWLSHLGDPAGLDEWLDRLPAATGHTDPTAAALRRARWAATHAAAADAPPGDLPDAARWRALQNVWAVWMQRGHAARARRQLEAEWPAALAHADVAARRSLAATCNNLAVELRCGQRGGAEVDALMLAAAEASRQLWASAGTWVHTERAEYQLARCHAVLGDGPRALVHARACHEAVQAHAGEPEADAFERFYAHEALAWAHLAAGDGASAAAERDRMRGLLDDVADPGYRAWAAGDLQALETALAPPSR